MPDSPSPWLWRQPDSEPQVDQTYISLIERGLRQIRDIGFLLQIARVLGIPPADLGLSNELMTESAGPGRDQGQRDSHGRGGSSRRLAGPQESVLSDQSDWRAVRRYLNHHRRALARQAAGLYPASQRVRRTNLIAPPSWLPPEPVDLADITMTWVPDAPG